MVYDFYLHYTHLRQCRTHLQNHTTWRSLCHPVNIDRSYCPRRQRNKISPVVFGRFLTLAGILLRTTGNINDWHLNLLVTIFTVIAAFVWCITGHVENVTESGLYWYVWSVLSILQSFVRLTTTRKLPLLYIRPIPVFLALAHLLYIRHIIKFLTSGPRRCQYLFRVISCFIIVITLMVGSICYKTDEIDSEQWEEWVIATEILLLIALIVDGILGFTQNRINGAEYGPVSQDANV